MQSIKAIYDQSFQEAMATIPEEIWEFSQVNNDGKTNDYRIEPQSFEKALHNKFGDFADFSAKFSNHLLGQQNIIAAFASTPVSFTDAWNMKAEKLTYQDALVLSKAGGHFQFNQLPNKEQSGSGLYQKGYAKGLVPSKGSGLTKGFRHSTGGIYEEDSLNEMGLFTYATPTDAAGMMEYRFIERFSKNLKIPLVYLITQWFRYETKFEEMNNWLYMTGVAEVRGTKDHPSDPISLQLISKDIALRNIEQLLKAIQAKGVYRIRPPMPEHLRLGWSYEKIKNNKSKRDLIIKHAQKCKFRCPGSDCSHVFFDTLKPNKIDIGHRISQSWDSQNTGIVEVHHPYNLYLTCKSCNIKLGKNYPFKSEKLINEMGTIGDWLMSGEMQQ